MIKEVLTTSIPTTMTLVLTRMVLTLDRGIKRKISKIRKKRINPMILMKSEDAQEL
jgi:hypothetical protein